MAFILTSCHSVNYKYNLLAFRDSNGKIVPVKDEFGWNIRRGQILDSLQIVMGPLPDMLNKVPADLRILEDTLFDGIRRLKISFAAEKNDRVPAYLFIPTGSGRPVPGILCLHQTTDIGKAEPAGLGGNPNLHYALELARHGYVTLAPDYPNFGDYKYDPYLNGYKSATMKGIWNHMAAIDILQALPEVDSSRIGCIGHSLGGHNSLFLAVFDKRVKAIVTSCGFTSFYKYYGGDLTGWSHKGYMPLISSRYDRNPDKMPFDFTEIVGAIAPRALFINAPLRDSNFEIDGVYDCLDTARPVYELLKAGNRIIMLNPDAPHDFPPEVRKAAYEFLDRELEFTGAELNFKKE
jgi:pimeloyl-ACP methyl ester carboxylesterase